MFRLVRACCLTIVLFVAPATPEAAEPAAGQTEAAAPQRERIVHRLQHLPAADVANSINGLLRSEQPEVHTVTIVAEPVTNSLLISGTSDEIKGVLALVGQLDRQPPTVLLRAILVEVTLPPSDQVQDDKAKSTVLDALKQSSLEGMIMQESGTVAQVSAEKLDSVLKQLQTAGQVHFLARPEIMALDNQPAFIQIGGRVALPAGGPGKEGEKGGGLSIENVGLILGVTPRVEPNGAVVVEVDLEQSKPKVGAGGPPQFDVKTLQTTVKAVNGQTVILGGLVTNSDEGRKELLMLLSAHVLPEKTE